MKNKFKKGDEVILTCELHPIPKGSIGKVRSVNSQYGNYTVDFPRFSSVSLAERFISSTVITLEELKNRRNELKIELEKIEDKMSFLSQTGEKEFNETVFKAYCILWAIEHSSLTKVEQAKKIAELVNGV